MTEDEEIEPVGLLPRRWQWTAALGASINLVANLGRAVSCWADDMATLLAQHTAARYEQEDFVDAIHADLESLPEA